MSYEDEKIVTLKFNNEGFKEEINETVKALQKLERSLDIDGGRSAKTFESLYAGCDKATESLADMDNALNRVQASFSALQIIGMTVLSDLTRSAMAFGAKIYNNTLGQIQSGGLARASNIENAKFQLEGLGVEWAKIQADLDYGVKDTAYGLDSAARAASQLVASGVQLGDEMQYFLRGISGVAAMTNRSYDEIAHIFTRVSGQGRVMGQDLQSLAASGLNAAKTLGDALGKTEAEIRDMVSKGQIDFKTFAKAMDDAFGAHAKDANKTFTGALSNMKAALSRLGADFIMPLRNAEIDVFNALKDVFNVVRKSSGGLVSIFTTAVNTASAWATQLLKNEKFLDGIRHLAYDVYTWIRTIWIALSEYYGFDRHLDNIADSFQNFSYALELWGDNAIAAESLLKSIFALFDAIGSVATGAVDVIIAVLDALGISLDNFDRYATKSDNFAASLEVIAKVLRKIAVVIKAVSYLVSGLLKLGLPAIINVVKMALLGLLSVFGAIGSGIMWLFDKVKNLADMFATLADNVVNVASNIKNKMFDAAAYVGDKLDDINFSFSTFFSNISNGFTNVVGGIKELFSRPATLSVSVASSDVESVTEEQTTLQKVYQKTTDTAKTLTSATSKLTDSLKIQNETISSGATGGKYLQGQFMAIELASKDAILAAAEANKDIAQSMALDTIAPVEEEQSTMDVIKKHVYGFVDNVKELFVAAKELLGNPWTLITTSIVGGSAITSIAINVGIVKIISAIIDGFSIIPKLVGGIADIGKSFKYAGVAAALREMSLVLVSVGALIATIAVISQFCDLDKLKDLMNYLAAMSGLGLLLMKTIETLTLVSTINTLVNQLTSGNASGKVSRTFLNMSKFFTSLAIFMGACLAGILTVYAVSEFAGGYDGLINAGLYIGGVLTAIVILTKILMWGLSTADVVSNGVTLSKAGLSFSRSAKTVYAGVTRIMLLMIPLIGMVGIATAALAAQDPESVTTATIAMLSSIAVMFTGLISTTLVAASVVKTGDKQARTIIPSATGSIARVMSMLATFMLGLSAFTASLAISLKILSGIKPRALYRGLNVLKETVGVIALALLVTGLVATAIMANAKSPTFSPTALYSAGGLLQGIGAAMMGIGVGMLAIAGSLGLISIIPITKINAAVSALQELLIPLGLLITVVAAITSFSGFVNSSMVFEVSTGKDIQAKTAQMAVILTAISGLVATMAASLALIAYSAKSPGDLDRSVDAFTAIVWTVVGALGVISLASSHLNIGSNKFQLDPMKNESITKSIALVTAMVATIAGALALVTSVSESPLELEKAGDVLTKLIWSMAGILGIVTVAMTKTSGIFRNGIIELTPLTKNLPAIAAMIGLLSGYTALVVAALVAIVKVGDIDGIEQASSILVSVMGALGLVLTSLTLLSMLPSLRPRVLQSLIWVMGGIGVMFVALGAMVALIGAVADKLTPDMVPALTMIGAFALIIGGVTVAIAGAMAHYPALAAGLDAFAIILLKLAAVCMIISASIAVFAYGLGALSSLDMSSFPAVMQALSAGLQVLDFGTAATLAGLALLSPLLLTLGVAMLAFAAALRVMSGVDAAIVAKAVSALSTFVVGMGIIIKKSIPVLAAVGAFVVLIASTGSSIGMAIAAIGIGILAGITAAAVGIYMFNKFPTQIKTAVVKFMDVVEYVSKVTNDSIGTILAFTGGLILFSAGLAIAGALMLGAGLTIGIGAWALYSGLIAISAAIDVVTGDGGIWASAGDKVGMLMAFTGGLILFSAGLAIAGALMLGAGLTTNIGAWSLYLGLLGIQQCVEIIVGRHGIMDSVGGLEGLGKLAAFALAFVTLSAGLATGGALMSVAGVLLVAATAALVIAGGAFVIAATLFGIGLTILSVGGALFAVVTLGIAVAIAAFTAVLAVSAPILLGAMTAYATAMAIFMSGSVPFLAGSVLFLGGCIAIAGGIAIISATIGGFATSVLVLAESIDMLVESISKAQDYISTYVEGIYQAGEDLVDGVAEGIENNDSAYEVVKTFAGGLLDVFKATLGIHSPSTEFATLGDWIPPGVGEGITRSAGKAFEVIKEFGSGLVSRFKSKMDEAGITGAGGLLDNFKKMLGGQGAMTEAEALGQRLGNAVANGLYKSTSEAYAAIGRMIHMQAGAKKDALTKSDAATVYRKQLEATYGTVEGGKKWWEWLNQQFEAIDLEEKAQREYYERLSKELDEQSHRTTGGFPSGGSTSSTSGDNTTGALTNIGTGGSGSGLSSLADTTSGNVGSAITNNTYNFVQNNYSPEPIDRTELYVQTNNQLNTWYKWLRNN